jgi:hypothetical protein
MIIHPCDGGRCLLYDYQGLKKEKWGRPNVMKLLSEMMASVSPDSSPERPFAILSAGWSSRSKNLQIPFSRPDPLFQ